MSGDDMTDSGPKLDGYTFDKHGTCDQCSEGDVDLCSASGEYPDAWICRACVAYYEQAVEAAVARYLNARLLRPTPEQLVRQVIDAFFDAFADPEASASRTDK